MFLLRKYRFLSRYYTNPICRGTVFDFKYYPYGSCIDNATYICQGWLFLHGYQFVHIRVLEFLFSRCSGCSEDLR